MDEKALLKLRKADLVAMILASRFDGSGVKREAQTYAAEFVGPSAHQRVLIATMVTLAGLLDDVDAGNAGAAPTLAKQLSETVGVLELSAESAPAAPLFSLPTG